MAVYLRPFVMRVINDRCESVCAANVTSMPASECKPRSIYPNAITSCLAPPENRRSNRSRLKALTTKSTNSRRLRRLERSKCVVKRDSAGIRISVGEKTGENVPFRVHPKSQIWVAPPSTKISAPLTKLDAKTLSIAEKRAEERPQVSAEDIRVKSMRVLSEIVGVMLLSRSVHKSDPGLSEEILKASRDGIG